MPLRRVVSVAIAVFVLTGFVLSVSGVAQQAPGNQQAGQAKPKPKAPPSAKLAEPWPDAEGMAKRHRDAEGRPLFKESEPLVFTLAANFKAVNGDRNRESTKTFPATLTLADAAGASKALNVTLRTRGNLRLNMRTCAFVPLRVTFAKQELAGTVFEGQSKLKLVTHCQDSGRYDQYVLREYLAYKLHNVITPNSFRARIAKATYVDAANGKTVASRMAIFLEDEDDVAKRMDGRVVSLPRMQFKDFDMQALTEMALFQFMIGNTDYSIYALHNVDIVATPAKVFYPIIWDFDISGLVAPPYGAPDPAIGIASIRERLYRGPCRTMDEYEPALAVFRSKQAEVMSLIEAFPGLEDRDRREVTEWVGNFYKILSRPDSLKKELVDRCKRQQTM